MTSNLTSSDDGMSTARATTSNVVNGVGSSGLFSNQTSFDSSHQTHSNSNTSRVKPNYSQIITQILELNNFLFKI
jgi:hypothetical protein